MAEKIKATVHNGRSGKAGVYNANHNTLDQTRQQQAHIDDSRTRKNVYYRFSETGAAIHEKKGFSAKDHEMDLYEKFYGEGLRERNERYAAEGHKEKMKTMNQIYTGTRTAPMETILQLGNIHSELDPLQRANALLKAFAETEKKMMAKYGKNLKPLDMALHRDESVDHIHFRCTFAAEDKFGHLIPNQAKALEQMGIQRPDPDKKQSKYNCPIISFTDEMREIFYQECERQGFTIDREVKNESHRQKSLLEMQCERLQQEVSEERTKREQAQEATRQAQEDTRKALEATRAAQEAQEAMKTKMEQAQAEMERLRASMASEKAKKEKLQQQVKELQKEKQDLNQENAELLTEAARKQSEIHDLKQEKDNLTQEIQDLQGKAEKTKEQIQKREEYITNVLRGNQGVQNVRVYEKIPEIEEKKMGPMVIRKGEPAKVLVNADDLAALIDQAHITAEIRWGMKEYEQLEQLQSHDPEIQRLREELKGIRMELSGKTQQLSNISNKLQTYQNFVHENNLEQKMQQQQQEQHRGYGRSR